MEVHLIFDFSMIHPFKYKQSKPLTPWRWSLLIFTLFLKARRDENAHP
jgi:hypothetical protein